MPDARPLQVQHQQRRRIKNDDILDALSQVKQGAALQVFGLEPTVDNIDCTAIYSGR